MQVGWAGRSRREINEQKNTAASAKIIRIGMAAYCSIVGG